METTFTSKDNAKILKNLRDTVPVKDVIARNDEMTTVVTHDYDDLQVGHIIREGGGEILGSKPSATTENELEVLITEASDTLAALRPRDATPYRLRCARAASLMLRAAVAEDDTLIDQGVKVLLGIIHLPLSASYTVDESE